MSDLVIRPALPTERSSLEALQWRASLANSGDRDALLANPDAIALPIEQIADGHVLVAERHGVIVGFAAVLPRPDGNAELDALFVEPSFWKRGVGRLLSATRTRKASMSRAASARPELSRLDSALVSRCSVGFETVAGATSGFLRTPR
jgi:GNAT superfamily N-acetyltransferase